MFTLNTILNDFIPAAHAEASTVTPAASNANNASFMLMLLVIILFMYFMVWRPQSKQVKERRELLNALIEGDEIVTTGGIVGRIVHIKDTYLIIAVADNINIVVQKSAITQALPKGTLKVIQSA